ncbi:MAG: DNA replication/repair protein RecF [Micrococcales bacterium]|nr:DNA replication/repair protein RecF [Micrococcales bacterium]
MEIGHLALRDFRSYHALDLTLEPGATVFLGANGQGKTNLLEAVGFLATLGSHRVSSTAPLIRVGAERALAACHARDQGRTTSVEIDIHAAGPNRARVNGLPATPLRSVLGHVKAVIFAPEDVALIKADPQARRAFLDQLLVQRTPRLAGVISDYERVLKQRASLLKTARLAGRSASLSTLDAWDAHLARHAASLTQARIALVHALAPLAAQAYAEVADGATFAATYRSSLPDPPAATTPELEEQILLALLQARPKEIERGVNLVGPHRDEMDLTISQLPARSHASHGETWSAALALRLASFYLLNTDDDGPPVLLLDDVFAELDSRRRRALTHVLDQADQALITCAVVDDVPAGLEAARFVVQEGRVERV